MRLPFALEGGTTMERAHTSGVARRMSSAAVSLSIVFIALAVSTTSPTAAIPATATDASGSRTSAAATAAAPRRGFWYAIGDRPTVAEVDVATRTFGVVVLNAWDGWALKRIKDVDPTVTVLMYKDLSSTRDYAEGYAQPRPSGVGYAEAEARDPSWFATDTMGHRIQWDPYPGHWQMTVWEPTYQARWARNVTGEVVEGGWDGVLADNDFAHLGYYSSALLSGTGTESATDARIRNGLDDMVTVTGSSLAAHGKLLVPNISEARLFPGRWTSHSRFGGAMEESFVHWDTNPRTGFLWDWGASGWLQQTSEMASAGLSLAVTRAERSDRRSQMYGYGSMLVRGDRTAYWSPSTSAQGDYVEPETIAEMSWPLGRPLTSGKPLASGAWVRTYDGAFVAVNPTTRSTSVAVPSGFMDAGGRVVGSVTVDVTSAVMLRRR